MGSLRTHIAITIDTSDVESEIRDLYEQINRENGLDDAAESFEQTCYLDGEFQHALFAGFVLENRDISDTANDLISNYDTDTEEW